MLSLLRIPPPPRKLPASQRSVHNPNQPPSAARAAAEHQADYIEQEASHQSVHDGDVIRLDPLVLRQLESRRSDEGEQGKTDEGSLRTILVKLTVPSATERHFPGSGESPLNTNFWIRRPSSTSDV
jgi:hypothetical protein